MTSPTGEDSLNPLQVFDGELAWRVVRLQSLDSLYANSLNETDSELNRIATSLPVAPGAGGMDVEHIEFKMRCRTP